MTIPSHTKNFMSAVVDPFGASQPARVPDLETCNSICFRDASETLSPLSPYEGDIYGLLIWVEAGYTIWDVNASEAQVEQSQYRLGMCGIDANGNIVLDTSGEFITVRTQNISTILGLTAPTGAYSLASSMVQSYRIFSIGLRVLPAIEIVTDSSIPYISYLISGQITMNEINNAQITGNIDMRTLLKNSPGSEVYSNNQGTTNRYDPFQDAAALEMKNLRLVWTASHDRSDVRFPTVLVTFSQPIATGETLPLIIHTQWWMEAVLKQPTPIYGSDSPVDPNFSTVRALMSKSEQIYPLITKGHSFASFASKVNQFHQLAKRIMKTSSSIFRTVQPLFRRRRPQRPRKRRAKTSKGEKPQRTRVRRSRRGIIGLGSQPNVSKPKRVRN